MSTAAERSPRFKGCDSLGGEAIENGGGDLICGQRSSADFKLRRNGPLR
jgi:hypothetical protein